MRPILALLALAACCLPAGAQPAYDAGRAKAFLAQHCVSCHGPEKQKGKLRLDTLAADFADPAHARVWQEVVDNLNLGEMPPPEEPKPDAAQQAHLSAWIAGELRAARRNLHAAGGRVVLRRLNRTEYANTIRDLLGITFLPGEGPLDYLPPDGKADGFDKVSAALTIDPSLLDKYYEVARRVANIAVVDGPPAFETKRTRFELEDTKKRSSIRYLCDTPGFVCRESDVMLMAGGTRSFDDLFYPGTNPRRRVPIKGMYAVRVRAAAEAGAKGEPVKMQIIRGGGGEGVILETEVTAPPDAPKVYEVVLPLGTDGGEFQVRIVNESKFRIFNPGYDPMNRAIEAAAAKKDYATVMRLKARMLSEGTLSGGAPNPETLDWAKLPKLFLDYIEIEGPLYEQWPPRSHQTLFFKGANGAKDAAYAREIFQRFMPKAFRRPVTDGEVDAVLRLVRQERAAGATFEESIRVGLSAVLTSPSFVFLFEPSPNDARRQLTDHELASRLSYFLWSSGPDEQLSSLAAAGKLREPATLAREIDRLLADRRSEALVNGFAAQWLRTDEFRNFKPDEKIYKAYDDKLGAAMVGQTLAFFEHVLRNDLPVASFLDSDWTVLNERLAKFYGIDGVVGEQFRLVPLPADSPRRGLLGQAGVMLRGSDGTRTKPVTRGVYVREVLFNDPPDPPPPNAGEIEPNIKGKNLTVRDRLIQHQKIEACAACHRGIDPYGLALENFNVIGAWRDRQDGEEFRGPKTPAIDASGKLPNGQSFKDYAEFRRLITAQDGRFKRALAEKLFTYALGRPVESSDRDTIEAITKEGDTLKRMMRAIVTSEAFRTK